MEITTFTGYDVIVLDRDLPRVHGDAVCASLVAGPAESDPAGPWPPERAPRGRQQHGTHEVFRSR